MDNDKPKCPFCGREMVFGVLCGQAWRCNHGQPEGRWMNGLYRGPDEDPTGSLVRAQIAAMEQRIHDAHPHTHPMEKDPESHLGVEPQPVLTCAEQVARHGRLRPDPAQQTVESCELPSKPATCGECGWAMLRDGYTDRYHCACAACKRSSVAKSTPSCPAGERRGE